MILNCFWQHEPSFRCLAMIDKSIPLSDLPTGQSAAVRRITGDPDRVHRLEEFGLRGGTRVEMFRRGNPCIVRMAGSKICLRTDEPLRILVEPDRPFGGTHGCPTDGVSG